MPRPRSRRSSHPIHHTRRCGSWRSRERRGSRCACARCPAWPKEAHGHQHQSQRREPPDGRRRQRRQKRRRARRGRQAEERPTPTGPCPTSAVWLSRGAERQVRSKCPKQ
eukprot:7382659-Alexandrium_andersonii.AAC.1